MTVHPEQINEITGQRIEGSAEVVDSRFANWAANEGGNDFSELEMSEEPEQDELGFEAPLFKDQQEALTETFDEVYNTDYSYSEEMAGAVAQADIGNSDAATTVKYLASQVYLNNLTPEQAFQQAVDSQIDPDKLLFSYYQLKSKLQ